MTPLIRRGLVLAALAAVLLAACSSGGKSSSSSPTSLLFQPTTSSTLPATPVVARVILPEKGSVQGSGGRGMVVALVFTAKDPSALSAQFRLGGALPAPATAVKPGHNPAFPGLVVAMNTTSTAFGGAQANLANLFQIVSPAVQADGSMQVSAVWTNAETGFGSDVDATLIAFTVPGTAPDVVPDSAADIVPNSNPAQVTFHISAGADSASAAAGATSTTVKGATTTTAKGATTTSTTVKGATTTVAPTTTKAPTAATTTTVVPSATTTTKFLGIF
jgi:hypothetical protein